MARMDTALAAAAHSHRRAAPFAPGMLCDSDAVASRLLRLAPQLSRYTAVSALALAVDFLVFLTLVGAVLQPSLAGAAGYGVGLAMHYALSVRYVFDAGTTGKSEARLFGEFIASGLIGMAITVLVIAVATDGIGLPPLLGKAAAVAASFLIVFLLRRSVVFAACSAGSAR